MPLKRSGKSSRRDPTSPGLAGISRDDFDAHRRGEISLSALGDRAGISRQAVGKLFRRWSEEVRSTAAIAPPPAAGAAPPPAPAAPTPAPTHPTVIDDPAELRRV